MCIKNQIINYKLYSIHLRWSIKFWRRLIMYLSVNCQRTLQHNSKGSSVWAISSILLCLFILKFFVIFFDWLLYLLSHANSLYGRLFGISCSSIKLNLDEHKLNKEITCFPLLISLRYRIYDLHPQRSEEKVTALWTFQFS